MSPADFSLSFMAFQLRINTFLALPFFVNRDFRVLHPITAFATYLYQYLSEIWMLLGFVSSYAALYVVWNDANVFFGCVSSTTHSTQAVGKVALLEWKKKAFADHLNKLCNILKRNKLLQFDSRIPNFESFASDSLRYIRILETALLAVTFAWTTVYFAPYLYNSFVRDDDVHERNTPIIGFIPFNYNATPAFRGVVVFQCVCFYFYNLKTVAVDYFVLVYLVLQVTHIKFLNVAAKFVTRKMESENCDENPRERESVLRIWLKQHQETMSIFKTSRELLSEYFLLEFAYIVVHTCVPVFVMTSTLSWTLNQKIVLAFFCTTGIVTLYLLSINGDNFTRANEESGVSLYGPHLFGNDSTCCLHAYRMVTFASRSSGSSAFGFSNVFPLCSITFGAIMRTVVSSYLALNQIKAVKS